MGVLSIFLNQNNKNSSGIGLTVSEQGIFVARIQADGIPEVLVVEAGKWLVLGRWVEKNKLSKTPVHVVLNYDAYHMYQVDPPSVPEEEMNQALLFSIRDRINYPVNEGQLDSFPLPQKAQRSNQSRVNVVVSHLPLLANITQGIRAAGLENSSIDIPELALGHLLRDHPDMGKGICLIAYREDKVTLMVYREDELYLSRTLSNIHNWSQCLDPESFQEAENLVLEIQRTLDYYQSQMAQPPVAKVLLPDWSVPLEPLLAFLGDNLGTKVELLEISTAEPAPPVFQQQSLALAIAGAQSANH